MLCRNGAGGTIPDQPAAAPGGENAAIAADQLGQTIRITLPLDHEVVSRVTRSVRQALDRARARGVRAVLIFEFDLARGAARAARGSRFSDAYELAHFLSGEELNAATTVAFLPKSIQGHAVLVALACDQIIMAEKATIGNAGADETTVDETVRPPTARLPAGGGPCPWNWPWECSARTTTSSRCRPRPARNTSPRPAWRNCGSTTRSNRRRC